MPTINLGKVMPTDADLIAKDAVYSTESDDTLFIAQKQKIKRLPVDKVASGASPARTVKIVDINSSAEDVSSVDLSSFVPGDVVLVIQGGSSSASEVSDILKGGGDA